MTIQEWKKEVADFLELNGCRLATKSDINDDARMKMIVVDPTGDNMYSRVVEICHIVLVRHPLANEKVYFRLVGVNPFANSLRYVPLAVFVGGVDAMMAPKSFLFVVCK